MTRLIIFISTFIIFVSCNRTKTEQVSNEQLSSTRTDGVDRNKRKDVIQQYDKKAIETFLCLGFSYRSPQAQADSLKEFMDRAKTSNSMNKDLWELKFFCTFPKTFEEMQEIFGYDDNKGAGPLYEYPIGHEIIQYFSNLTTVPDDKFYTKYVSININGVWEADNIRNAFGFHNRLLTDTESTCSTLSKYTDKEIESVFRFVFDGPHPNNEDNKQLYRELKRKLDNENQRLSKLLTQSYERLMARDDGHGH